MAIKTKQTSQPKKTNQTKKKKNVDNNRIFIPNGISYVIQKRTDISLMHFQIRCSFC